MQTLKQKLSRLQFSQQSEAHFLKERLPSLSPQQLTMTEKFEVLQVIQQ